MNNTLEYTKKMLHIPANEWRASGNRTGRAERPITSVKSLTIRIYLTSVFFSADYYQARLAHPVPSLTGLEILIYQTIASL